MNVLPQDSHLDIGKLTAIFGSTTNSYKYLWFFAILESLYVENISMKHLVIKMVVKVWYPIHTYHLSFGKQDSFAKSIKILLNQNPFLVNYKSQALENWLIDNMESQDVAKIINKLLEYVPFRFLSPFFSVQLKSVEDGQKHRLIMELASSQFLNEASPSLYTFSSDKSAILIHPTWKLYLQQHQQILTDFCKWHLLLYLQKNNPNVPNIAEKLEPEKTRDLNNGKEFWSNVLNDDKAFYCIYSEQSHPKSEMSIDHFLPWSFAGHDLLWNLLPTTKSINSKKSDCLPDLLIYLTPFLKLQHAAFQSNFRLGKKTLLEDYCILFANDLDDISRLSEDEFHNKLEKNIRPMYQIAQNMGFTSNWKL